MIPEIGNGEEVDFQYKTKKDLNEENKRVQLDNTGNIIRHSHSHYYGYLIRGENQSYKFSLPDSFAIPNVYLKKSKIFGYGVFANTDFKIGDVIEETVCILLNTTIETVDDWVLNKYAIEWECDCDICKSNGRTLFISPGYVMMYNHSKNPNVHLQIEKPFKRVKLIALRDIKKDEELTYYYGVNYIKRLELQKQLDIRTDVAEDMPAGFVETNTPCGNKNNIESPNQLKSDDSGVTFKGRTIE
jgi:hypothetical protein